MSLEYSNLNPVDTNKQKENSQPYSNYHFTFSLLRRNIKLKVFKRAIHTRLHMINSLSLSLTHTHTFSISHKAEGNHKFMCHSLQGQNTDISSYLICTLYETIHMEQTKVLSSLTRKWFAFFCVIGARATAQDQTDMKATGLLCISDCTSCPVICAPPPPPSESKPPPSPSPQSYYFHSPPPPSYISWGNSAPPPPKFMTIPATQVPPAGGTGQNNNYVGILSQILIPNQSRKRLAQIKERINSQRILFELEVVN